MRTNLSDETLDLLGHAQKASICMLDPIIKEELIFRALINLQHPLWLVIKNQFGLDENRIKNLSSNELLNNHSDDPDILENRKRQKEYFDLANKEARKDNSCLIEPIHLVKAIFLAKENDVIRIFKASCVRMEVVTEELNKLSYSDLVKALEKNRVPKIYAPSRDSLRRSEQFSFGSKSDSQLTNFGRNLNQLAKDGKLDPVYFRDEEIKTTIEILCRKQQNNPLLVGEAGVGKTAIVEGIAQLIISGNVPEVLKNREIIELNIMSLVAGTTLRGQFEGRIQSVIDECAKNQNIILFIDEIHMIVGAGGDRGLSDAANIFKPALARGSLRCIGATTTKENDQFIEKDKALKRRFSPVFVNEPTTAQTIQIINKCKGRFEKFHGVQISDEAVKIAVRCADQYIKDKRFPGKAIDLLDHACACEKIDPNSDKMISPEEVAQLAAKVAQVPITRILGQKNQELLLLEQRLKERVIGQEEAIQTLLDAIYLIQMGMLMNLQQPEGVLLFVGPAVVGMTELAKSLTAALLGDETRIVNFDMTEFKDPMSINKLLGAAPGYVGYEQESKLVSCIRSNPNSIILMDSIEEAHPDILSLLKQIFEKGALTTQDGEMVYFSYATFILISNIGAEAVKNEDLKNLEYNELCARVKSILKTAVDKRFNPSFLNTIDKVIYFDPLKREWIRKIVFTKIAAVLKRLEERKIKIIIGDEVHDFLVDKGYSIMFGAKGINKIIENELLKPLAVYLAACDKKDVSVSISEDKKLLFSCG
ncbi:MAG: ATP-dependent Clp protease ATP-binding subunit [Candidatus Omnitrophica bacterium]|nr:ATP-dependent Clp protease ATP-binding subunit [Candidatus Omnitrophota bacterium]